MQFYYYSLAAGIVAVLIAIYSALQVLKKPTGTPKMNEIAKAIREGASAYLNRQLVTIMAFAVIIAVLLIVCGYYGILPHGGQIAIAFAVGAIASYLTAFFGMNIAVRSNLRTAKSAEKGTKEAFWTAMLGGSVTGLAAVGFSLVGLSLLLAYLTVSNILLLIGFGFGASIVSLFARVGGGIFTKAADVGADLVGKTELNLPEDDPRNPAVIADNVGDNVGDCAGMAADVFESYSVTLVAALLIATTLAGGSIVTFAFPLYVAIVGLIGSIISIPIMKKFGNKPNKALYAGIGSAVGISAILDIILVGVLGMRHAGALSWSIIVPVLSGLILAMLLFWVADYYTGGKSKSVIRIADASKSGAGTNVITGLAVGLQSTWMPVLFIVIAILASFAAGGVYGIGIAAVGMLSITPTILTIDSFGPITDNAGGIAEMAGLPSSVRKVTDHLDALGNTTKATTKAYAIGGAALSATALLVAFASAVKLTSINALDPVVMVGVFIGALLPFVFSSFLMGAVGYTANLMVEEVRRQVRTIKGLMEGKAKPDYAKAVDIATVNALKSLALPELIAIVVPIAVGLILGPQALGGLLVGMIPASLMLALFMANSGAAMDNAKKYIESGKYGGKGSDAHKAAVVGDTLGDPLKDTAGPALNSMIKVVSTIAILLAPLFIMFALHI